jgi:probable rRNA maturation factor
MTKPTIDIAVESPLWTPMKGIAALVERAVTATLSDVQIELRAEVELSVLLCDDSRIRTLNRDWRSIDEPTNVLAFPAIAAEPLNAVKMLGDIVLAFETVDREAQRDGQPFEDHLGHLLVHGLLHLLGHDHGTPDEAEQMEAIERRVLQALNIADPYRGTKLLETPVP